MLALVSVAGCASAPQHLSESQANIKSIAIVSVVPDRVNLEKTGLTVFNNQASQIDMGSSVTDTIYAIARKRIQLAHPGWQVKAVDYDKGALLGKARSAGLLLRSPTANMSDELAALAKKNDVDAILVVVSYRDASHGYDDGITVRLHTLNLSTIQHAYVRAIVNVAIVDRLGAINVSGDGGAVTKLDAEGLGLKYELKENDLPVIQEKLKDAAISNLQNSMEDAFKAIGF